MNDLTAARDQLEKAIVRLEAALTAEPGGAADASVEKAMKAARSEYDNLRAAADDVSNRIDDIIARLHATLEADLDR
jgi:hypothetical protein